MSDAKNFPNKSGFMHVLAPAVKEAAEVSSADRQIVRRSKTPAKRIRKAPEVSDVSRGTDRGSEVSTVAVESAVPQEIGDSRETARNLVLGSEGTRPDAVDPAAEILLNTSIQLSERHRTYLKWRELKEGTRMIQFLRDLLDREMKRRPIPPEIESLLSRS